MDNCDNVHFGQNIDLNYRMFQNIEMFKNASDEGLFWVQNAANL